MKYFWYGPLAQLVEQLTLNQRVAGSSPSRPIGCQTHGTGKCWCESISKTFMLFHFFFKPFLITLKRCNRVSFSTADHSETYMTILNTYLYPQKTPRF